MLSILRPMITADEPEVMRIQQSAYQPRFHEDWQVFADKLRLFPDGCWTAEAEGAVAGYLFSHPSDLANPPALNHGMVSLPPSPDCYYIHDAAIMHAQQPNDTGSIRGKMSIPHARADCYRQMALIAVQGSERFWGAQGFARLAVSSEVADKLRGYSEDAVYMRRVL